MGPGRRTRRPGRRRGQHRYEAACGLNDLDLPTDIVNSRQRHPYTSNVIE